MDDCNVMGYTVWSLLDGIDRTYGTRAKYGLYHVDFNDPFLSRTPKMSAKVYSQIIAFNGLMSSLKNVTPNGPTVHKENDPNRELQYENEMYYGKFPDGFAWSSATASYQVEGAWNEDGTYSKMKNLAYGRNVQYSTLTRSFFTYFRERS